MYQYILLYMIPRRSEKKQNADLRAVETQASPVNAMRSHRTPGDGAHFVHAQNKRRGNAVPIRAQWNRREVAVAPQ